MVVAEVVVAFTMVRLVMVEVALLTKSPPLMVAKPLAVRVPMLTKLPLTSRRLVPAPAPVFKPVVPFNVVPVMVSALSMVPKPEVMEPLFKAATVVSEEVTTAEPKVVAFKVSTPLMLRARPVAKLRLPLM